MKAARRWGLAWLQTAGRRSGRERRRLLRRQADKSLIGEEKSRFPNPVKAALIALAVAGIYLTGVLEVLDLKLLDVRYSLLSRSAKSDIVIVAIDPKSLQELGSWPWPRSLHAFLLDRLAEEGAVRVALDIDFSSNSLEDSDLALEQALARFPGPVILPGFLQRKDPLGVDGNLVKTFPLERFRAQTALASVNVAPDRDGRVRRLDPSTRLAGQEVPSLSLLLAQPAVAGRAPDQVASQAHMRFAIDFGIRPETLPVVSFSDVLAARHAPGLFVGRTVLIGATAVELGDLLPVPVHQVLPGVLLQALGAESLVQGRALRPVPPWIVMLALFPLSLLCHALLRRRLTYAALTLVLAGPPVLFLLSCGLQASRPLMLDVAPLALAILGSCAFEVLGTLRLQQRHLLAQHFALRRQDRLMKGVFEHSFDAIVTVDQDGRVTSSNPSARALLCAPGEDLKDREVESFFRHDEGAEGKVCGVACLAGMARGGHPYELQGRRASGRLFPLEASVTSFEETGEATFVVLFRDITARKESEAAIERSRRELVAAKERAEAADRAKTAFLGNMSHELRTPLNAVLGFSELMKGEMLGPMANDAYLGYAKDIHESGSHLLQMIQDLLDISKIETGGIVVEDSAFDLAQTVEACLRMVRLRAEAAEVDLPRRLEGDPLVVLGDERLIKQALLNVVSNAIKFSPPGGRVEITLETRATGAAALVVADSGPGIPEAELQAVLAPFRHRDSAVARPQEGAGLGLPLSKAYLELHGGRLLLDSRPGEGTRVTLLLPAERVRPGDPEETAQRLVS